MSSEQAETWHLSTGYTEHWAIYCDQPYRRHVDFRTFSTEEVTCPRCYDVAVDSWGKAAADQRTWGIA